MRDIGDVSLAQFSSAIVERDHAMAEVARLRKILDMPLLEPFAEAAVSEARHQVYRWGEEHDISKTAWDWFWTLGYLGGKAAHAAIAGNREKAKHHTVTAAALLANWHRQICGTDPEPTIEAPTVRCERDTAHDAYGRCNACNAAIAAPCGFARLQPGENPRTNPRTHVGIMANDLNGKD